MSVPIDLILQTEYFVVHLDGVPPEGCTEGHTMNSYTLFVIANFKDVCLLST